MKAHCCRCNNEYEELDEEIFFLVEAGCTMICYDCCRAERKKDVENFNRSLNEDRIQRQNRAQESEAGIQA